MLRRLFISYLLLAFASTVPVFAQQEWKATYTAPVVDSILYTISKDHFAGSNAYYFPAYDGFPPLSKGYELINNKTAKRADNDFIATITFRKELSINTEDILWLQRCYTKNIKQYKVVFHTDKGEYNKEYNIQYSAYQSPVLEKIGNTQAQNRSLKLLSVTYTATPIDVTKPVLFVAGELMLFRYHRTEIESQHPFFAKLWGRQPDANPEMRAMPVISDYPPPALYAPFNDILNSQIRPTINIKKEGSTKVEEIEQFEKTILFILGEYPFYEERHLDKSAIIRQCTTLFNSHSNDTSVCNIAGRLSKFIDSTFDDGHFRILPCNGGRGGAASKSPLLINQFMGQYYVSGIADENISKRLPIGSELIAVEGIAATSLNYKELLRKLSRPAGDSVHIAVRKGDYNDNITILYQPAYKTDSRFYPTHCEFMKPAPDIAYFRINSWEHDVLTRFINNWDSIDTAKRGLILDLRSNSGGSSIAARRLFSLFINKPEVYSNAIFFNNPRWVESTVVPPDTKFNYSKQRPVIILANENTSCASEEFMMAMKTLPNVVFIGSAPTKGVLAERVDLKFPSGVTVYCDAVQPKKSFPHGEIIEGRGIYPDIVVLLRTVDDLYAYKDKLLRVAVDYLNNHKL